MPRLQKGNASGGAQFPCQYYNNSTKRHRDAAEERLKRAAKSLFALEHNVLEFVKEHGIERVGCVLLTFPCEKSLKSAQERFNSLNTHVLKKRYPHYISVIGRAKGRLHFHLLVARHVGIRATIQETLSEERRFLASAAKKYGFGICGIQPVRKEAKAVAGYMAKNVRETLLLKTPGERGARLIRYSRGVRKASAVFSWNSRGAREYRRKLSCFAVLAGFNENNYREGLKKRIGPRWMQLLRSFLLQWDPDEPTARLVLTKTLALRTAMPGGESGGPPGGEP